MQSVYLTRTLLMFRHLRKYAGFENATKSICPLKSYAVQILSIDSKSRAEFIKEIRKKCSFAQISAKGHQWWSKYVE